MWQMQTRELSAQGLKAEYEDMLDHELLTLWPLAKEKGRDQELKKLLYSGLDEPDRSIDRLAWAKQKRIRCWDKKMLAMELAHDHFPLINRTPDFSADMDEYQKYMVK